MVSKEIYVLGTGTYDPEIVSVERLLRPGVLDPVLVSTMVLF
jgi:hypothetical protein